MMANIWEIDNDPDLWYGFGTREAWEEAYAREHGGKRPGEYGGERWEEAYRNMAWSQSYWPSRHGNQPMTEEVWKAHFYRPADFDDVGQYEQKARNVIARYRAAMPAVQYQPVSGTSTTGAGAKQGAKANQFPTAQGTAPQQTGFGVPPVTGIQYPQPIGPQPKPKPTTVGQKPLNPWQLPTTPPTTMPRMPSTGAPPYGAGVRSAPIPTARPQPQPMAPLPPFISQSTWGPTTPYTGLPAPATNRTPSMSANPWALPTARATGQQPRPAPPPPGVPTTQQPRPVTPPAGVPPFMQQPNFWNQQTQTAQAQEQAARSYLASQQRQPSPPPGVPTTQQTRATQPMQQAQPPPPSYLPMFGQGYGRAPVQQPVAQRVRQAVPPNPTPSATQTPYYTGTDYPGPWSMGNLMNPAPAQQAREAYDRQQKLAAEARARAEQQRRQAEQRQRQQQAQQYTNILRRTQPESGIPGFTDPYMNQPTGAMPVRRTGQQVPQQSDQWRIAQEMARRNAPTIERQSAITPPAITSGQRSPTITIQTPGATINIAQNPWDAGQQFRRGPGLASQMPEPQPDSGIDWRDILGWAGQGIERGMGNLPMGLGQTITALNQPSQLSEIPLSLYGGMMPYSAGGVQNEVDYWQARQEAKRTGAPPPTPPTSEFGIAAEGEQGWTRRILESGDFDITNSQDLTALTHMARMGYTLTAQPDLAAQIWPEFRAARTNAERDALVLKYQNATTELIGQALIDPLNFLGVEDLARLMRSIPGGTAIGDALSTLSTPAAKVERTATRETNRLMQFPQMFDEELARLNLDPSLTDRLFGDRANWLTQPARFEETAGKAQNLLNAVIAMADNPEDVGRIIDAFATGNRQALDQLAARYGNSVYDLALLRVGGGIEKGQKPILIARDVLSNAYHSSDLRNLTPNDWPVEMVSRIEKPILDAALQRAPIVLAGQETNWAKKAGKFYVDMAYAYRSYLSAHALMMRPAYAIRNAMSDTFLRTLDLGGESLRRVPVEEMMAYLTPRGWRPRKTGVVLEQAMVSGPISRTISQATQKIPIVKTMRNLNMQWEADRYLITSYYAYQKADAAARSAVGRSLANTLPASLRTDSTLAKIEGIIWTTPDAKAARRRVEEWVRTGQTNLINPLAFVSPEVKRGLLGEGGDLGRVGQEIIERSATVPLTPTDQAKSALDIIAAERERRLAELAQVGVSGDLPHYHIEGQQEADYRNLVDGIRQQGQQIGTDPARVQTMTDGAAGDLEALHTAENQALTNTAKQITKMMDEGQLGDDGPWLMAQVWKQAHDGKMDFIYRAQSKRQEIADLIAAGRRPEAAGKWNEYFPWAAGEMERYVGDLANLQTSAIQIAEQLGPGIRLSDVLPPEGGRFVARDAFIDDHFADMMGQTPVDTAAITGYRGGQFGADNEAFNAMLESNRSDANNRLSALWVAAADSGDIKSFEIALNAQWDAALNWQAVAARKNALREAVWTETANMPAGPAQDARWQKYFDDVNKLVQQEGWANEKRYYDEALNRIKGAGGETGVPVQPHPTQPTPTEVITPARATTPTGEGVVTPPARTPPVTETVTALTRQEKIDALLWREMDAGQPVNVAERRRELGRLSDNELNRLIDEAQGTPTTPARTAQPPQQTVPKAGPTVAQERPLPSVRTLGPRIEGWALDVTELGNQQARLQRRLRDDPRFTAYRTYLSTLQDYFEQGSLGWAEPSLEFAEGYVPTVPTLRPVIDAARREIDSAFGSGAFDNLEYSHETLVRRAAEAGRDVPQENLAHYADSDWYQDLLHRRQLAGPERPSPQQDVGLTPTTQPTLAPEVPPRAVTETQPAKADRAQLQQSIRDAAIKQDVESATKVGKPQEQRIIRKWLPGSKAKTLDSLSDNDLRNLQAKMGGQPAGAAPPVSKAAVTEGITDDGVQYAIVPTTRPEVAEQPWRYDAFEQARANEPLRQRSRQQWEAAQQQPGAAPVQPEGQRLLTGGTGAPETVGPPTQGKVVFTEENTGPVGGRGWRNFKAKLGDKEVLIQQQSKKGGNKTWAVHELTNFESGAPREITRGTGLTRDEAKAMAVEILQDEGAALPPPAVPPAVKELWQKRVADVSSGARTSWANAVRKAIKDGEDIPAGVREDFIANFPRMAENMRLTPTQPVGRMSPREKAAAEAADEEQAWVSSAERARAKIIEDARQHSIERNRKELRKFDEAEQRVSTSQRIPAPAALQQDTGKVGAYGLTEQQRKYTIAKLEEVAKQLEKGGKPVTIEVPGDGLVTVSTADQARNAAEKFSERLVSPRGYPTAPAGGGRGEIGDTAFYRSDDPRALNKTIHEQAGGFDKNRIIPATIDSKPAFTDGAVAALGKAEDVAGKKGVRGPLAQDMTAMFTETGQRLVPEGYLTGPEKMPMVALRADDGSLVYIQSKYYRYFMDKYPEFEKGATAAARKRAVAGKLEFGLAKNDVVSSVVVTYNGKRVGYIGTIDLNTSSETVKGINQRFATWLDEKKAEPIPPKMEYAGAGKERPVTAPARLEEPAKPRPEAYTGAQGVFGTPQRRAGAAGALERIEGRAPEFTPRRGAAGPAIPALEQTVPVALDFLDKVEAELMRVYNDPAIWQQMMGQALTLQEQKALRAWAQANVPQAMNTVRHITQKTGQQIADFSAGSPHKQYLWDALLSGVVPYSYWFTRQGTNMIRRFATRPGVLNQIVRHERAMEQVREENDLPSRTWGQTLIKMPDGSFVYFNALGMVIPGYDMSVGIYKPTYWKPEGADESKEMLAKAVQYGREGFEPYPWISTLFSLGGLIQETPGEIWQRAIVPSLFRDAKNLTAVVANKAPGLGIPEGGWSGQLLGAQLAPVTQYDDYYFQESTTNAIVRGLVTPQEVQMIDLLWQDIRQNKLTPEQAIQRYPQFAQVWQDYVDTYILPRTVSGWTGLPVGVVPQARQEGRAARNSRIETVGEAPSQRLAAQDGKNWFDLTGDEKQEYYEDNPDLRYQDNMYWLDWAEQMPQAQQVKVDFNTPPDEARADLASRAFWDVQGRIPPKAVILDDPLIADVVSKENRESGYVELNDYLKATAILYAWLAEQQGQPQPAEVAALGQEVERPAQEVVTDYDTSSGDFWDLYYRAKDAGVLVDGYKPSKHPDIAPILPPDGRDAVTPAQWQAAAAKLADALGETYAPPDLSVRPIALGDEKEIATAKRRWGTLFDERDRLYPDYRTQAEAYKQTTDRSGFYDTNPTYGEAQDWLNAQIEKDPLLRKYYGSVPATGEPTAATTPTTTTPSGTSTTRTTTPSGSAPKSETEISYGERNGRAPGGEPTQADYRMRDQIDVQVEAEYPGWGAMRKAYLAISTENTDARRAFRDLHPEYTRGYDMRQMLLEQYAPALATVVDGQVFYYNGPLAAANRIERGEARFRVPLYQNLRGGEWGSGYGGGGSFRSPIQYRGIQSRPPQPVQWRGIGNVWRLPELRTKGR